MATPGADARRDRDTSRRVARDAPPGGVRCAPGAVLAIGLALGLAGAAAPRAAAAGDSATRLLKRDLAARTFTLASDQGPIKAGSSEKYLIVDDEAALWLFKPMPKAHAHIEEVGYRLAALLGLHAPETFGVILGGTGLTGSLSRIVPCQGSLKDRTPEQLTPAQVVQVQRLQVFAWLIGNFDTHARNFLVGESGNIVTYDHGRAFASSTFFRHDIERSDPYDPFSYFAPFWQAHRQGLISAVPGPLLRFADHAAAADDRAIEAVLAPLARFNVEATGAALRDERGRAVYATPEEFLRGMLLRRRMLRRGFESFYARMAAPVAAPEEAAADPAGAAAKPPLLPSRTDPSDEEPLPIAYTGDGAVFSRLARGKNRLSMWLRARRQRGLATTLKGVGFHAAAGVARLAGLLDGIFGPGLSLDEVRELDLERLDRDPALRERLRATPDAGRRLLRERAEFALLHAQHEDERQRAQRALSALRE
jgi:hypothetical protein